MAVCTRSTVACVFGSLLFWMTCWGMNFGRLALQTLDLEGLSPMLEGIVEVGYWVLPKPADFGMLLFDALRAHDYFTPMFNVQELIRTEVLQPDLSVATSLLSAGAILGLAAHQLNTTDY